MPKRLDGIRGLVPDFDAFFVDLWGVVHDGGDVFEGVREALEHLAAAKKHVVFVTNTSRTHDAVEKTLHSLGIRRSLFAAVVTAGDVTRAALVAREPAVFGGESGAEARCLHVGNAAFVPWLFEIGLHFTDDRDEADVIIATGAVDDEVALEAIRRELEPLARRDVPLVCTNPDRVIPTPAGPKPGPGAIAHVYRELGARTFLYGKPHAPIYAAARKTLDATDARSLRILALGDLLETDVRGACEAGLPSALVLGASIHASEARTDDAAFEREGVVPDYVVERFRL